MKPSPNHCRVLQNIASQRQPTEGFEQAHIGLKATFECVAYGWLSAGELTPAGVAVLRKSNPSADTQAPIPSASARPVPTTKFIVTDLGEQARIQDRNRRAAEANPLPVERGEGLRMVIGTRPAVLSPRGIPLALAVDLVSFKVGDPPRLTVELHTKWYSLFLIVFTASGPVVSTVHFHDCRLPGETNLPYVDHVPNPTVVRRFAEHRGYDLDVIAEELIVGRWRIEVEDY